MGWAYVKLGGGPTPPHHPPNQVHTSEGQHSVPLAGYARSSVYDVHRVDVLLPLANESTVVAPLSLYNPHAAELRVQELLILDKHFDVRLPEAGDSVWVIPPLQRRDVGQVELQAPSPGRCVAPTHSVAHLWKLADGIA